MIYVVCVAVDKLPKEEDNGEAEMKGWKVKEREGVEWPVWCCTLTSGTDGESTPFKDMRSRQGGKLTRVFELRRRVSRVLGAVYGAGEGSVSVE